MLRKDAKIQLLKSVPLFSLCSRKELRLVADATGEVDIQEGTVLTLEGEPGRDFWVIVEGAAEVRRRGRKVNTLGPGDFLGEIALLTGDPRTATVTTTAPTHALVLSGSAFKAVTEQVPSVQWSVVQALAARLHADAV